MTRQEFTGKELLLYAVTDRSWLKPGQTLAGRVEQALMGGATMVQLREKDCSHEERVALAREVKQVTDRFGVPFLIDDDIQAALEAGADGVHVGQSDLDAREARRLLGEDKILGVTAHNSQEARRALEAGADYLGTGDAFGSATKQDTIPADAAGMKAVCDAVGLPVVAIGGITAGNICRLRGRGLSGVAVVSALFASDNVRAAARELRYRSAEMVFAPPVRGAIFDLDGTLLDSMRYWRRVGEDYLLRVGIQPPENLEELLQPLGFRESARLFQGFGVPGTEEEIMAGIMEMMEERYRCSLPLKEGAEQLLRRLKAQGLRLCIATATKAPLPQLALERLGLADAVEFVLTCDEAGRGKDFPDIYLQCARRLGLPPQEIWVFEDSLHCVRTARHAGFPVIGVFDEDSAGNWEKIKERSSGWVLSLRELLRD